MAHLPTPTLSLKPSLGSSFCVISKCCTSSSEPSALAHLTSSLFTKARKTHLFVKVFAWQNQQNELCAQRRLRWAWAFAQSDQSPLRCPHEESLVLSFLLSAQRRLWSADTQADLFSLGIHAISLVLSCGGSFLYDSDPKDKHSLINVGIGLKNVLILFYVSNKISILIYRGIIELLLVSNYRKFSSYPLCARTSEACN